MNTRYSKLFLLIVAFALAIAPLRGAFALMSVSAGSADAESHCAQMQAGNDHPPEQQQALHDQGAEAQAGHDCEQGCDGACCEGTCNACAHGVLTAMSGTLPVNPGFEGALPDSRYSHAFPERSLPPPLHPPATLLN